MQDPWNGCDSGDLEAPSRSQWVKADASKNLACLTQRLLQEGNVNTFSSQFLLLNGKKH